MLEECFISHYSKRSNFSSFAAYSLWDTSLLAGFCAYNFTQNRVYYDFSAVQYNNRCVHLNQIEVRKAETDYLSMRFNSKGFIFLYICCALLTAEITI